MPNRQKLTGSSHETSHLSDLRSHLIFTHNTFYTGFVRDLDNALGAVLIQSPYLTVGGIRRIEHAFVQCIRRGVRVCSFAQEPRLWSKRNDETISPNEFSKMQQLANAIDYARKLGLHVSLRRKIHEKLLVIDDHVFWDGSLNPLSHFDTSERMNRWDSKSMTRDAMDLHGLKTCDQCATRMGGFMQKNGRSEKNECLRLLGERIAERRRCLKLTQAKLAVMTQQDQGTISRIESGTADCYLSTIIRVAEAIELRIALVPEFFLPAIESYFDADAG